MKKFIFKIILFGVGLLVIDKSLLLIRNSSPELLVDKRLENLVTGKIQSDILIFGSSRGARSVDASQMADSLKRSCYNLSFPGSDITFHEYLIRETLENPLIKKPKLIIFVIDDADELKRAVALKFRYDIMYPLVKYDRIRDELVKRNQKKWGVNEVLVAHQINRKFFLFKQKKFTKRDSVSASGSMLLWYQKKTFNKVYKETPYIYSEKGELFQKLEAFKQIVKQCKENNIPLLVAIPPNFRPATTGFKERLEELMQGYGTVFVFNKDEIAYKDEAYFFDNAHLLANGAHVFTDELIKEVTKIE